MGTHTHVARMGEISLTLDCAMMWDMSCRCMRAECWRWYIRNDIQTREPVAVQLFCRQVSLNHIRLAAWASEGRAVYLPRGWDSQSRACGVAIFGLSLEPLLTKLVLVAVRRSTRFTPQNVGVCELTHTMVRKSV
jgi:hypothetical protein